MEMTRTIAAGRRPLFDFLIDLRNERFFGPTIRECRLERPSPGVTSGAGEGAEFVFAYAMVGFVLETRLRIEGVLAGERYVIRSIKGAIPFTMEYLFQDAGPECRLTVRTNLLAGGWFAWVRPLAAPIVRRDMNAYMDALVRFCAERAKERSALPSAADRERCEPTSLERTS